MDGSPWRKHDRSRSSGRQASKQVSSESMVLTAGKLHHILRAVDRNSVGVTPRQLSWDGLAGWRPQVGNITQKYNMWERGGLCSASKVSIRQLQLSWRAEVTSKEDKLCHSTFPRLEGTLPELQGSWCWDWDGPGMSKQILITDLQVAKKVIPVSHWLSVFQ